MDLIVITLTFRVPYSWTYGCMYVNPMSFVEFFPHPCWNFGDRFPLGFRGRFMLNGRFSVARFGVVACSVDTHTDASI